MKLIDENLSTVSVSHKASRWNDEDIFARVASGTKARIVSKKEFSLVDGNSLVRYEVEIPSLGRGWVHTSTVHASIGSKATKEIEQAAVPAASPSGSVAASANSAPRKLTKSGAQAMLKEMEVLQQQGREMEPLRSSDDDSGRLDKLRRCGELMRERQARVREIRKRAEDLPDSVLDLRIAATHLELCVSCSKGLALSNCNHAREELRQGKAELAGAAW